MGEGGRWGENWYITKEKKKNFRAMGGAFAHPPLDSPLVCGKAFSEESFSNDYIST